jgi:hypothetical protein
MQTKAPSRLVAMIFRHSSYEVSTSSVEPPVPVDESFAAVRSHFLSSAFGACGVGMPGDTYVHTGLRERNRSRLADAGVGSCHDGVSRIKGHVCDIPCCLPHKRCCRRMLSVDQ